MAVYECDWGRHRYPQPQQSIYYTHVIGASADTYKMRMCPTHFRESLVIIGEEMAELDEHSQMSLICDKCGKDRCAVLYAKVFPAKDEAKYFVADFCAACISAVGNTLRIFNGSTLTARTEGLQNQLGTWSYSA
jgi:hypothetical protein